MKNNECRLRVHDRVLGMRFQPGWHAERVREYFDCKSSPEKVDILLDLKIRGRKAHFEIDNSLFTSKTVNKRGFTMSGGLVGGMYDRDSKYGKLIVHRLLMTVPAIRVFEQLLYQAFYTSMNSESKSEFLIHSSAVVRNGGGYLFVGPPGAGKSTIARLSLPDPVLNDEVNLVCFSGDKIEVCSTPFNGLFRLKSEGCHELRAVLLLRQGVKHQLTESPATEAIKVLMQEMVTSAHSV